MPAGTDGGTRRAEAKTLRKSHDLKDAARRIGADLAGPLSRAVRASTAASAAIAAVADRLDRLAGHAIGAAACLDSVPPSPLVAALQKVVVACPGQDFEGTAQELIDRLNAFASDEHKASPAWPMSANAIGARLAGLEAELLAYGLHVSRRKSGIRTIRIVNTARTGG